MMCLRRALGVATVALVGGVLLMAAAVCKVPAFVMLTAWRFFGKEPVMSQKHHFNMVETHIGAIPVLAILCRRLDAFRRAGGLIGVIGREMCLTEIGRVIADPRQ